MPHIQSFVVLIWHCQICTVKTYAFVCKTPQDEGNNHILIQIRYHSTTLGWMHFYYIQIGFSSIVNASIERNLRYAHIEPFQIITWYLCLYYETSVDHLIAHVDTFWRKCSNLYCLWFVSVCCLIRTFSVEPDFRCRSNLRWMPWLLMLIITTGKQTSIYKTPLDVITHLYHNGLSKMKLGHEFVMTF